MWTKIVCFILRYKWFYLFLRAIRRLNYMYFTPASSHCVRAAISLPTNSKTDYNCYFLIVICLSEALHFVSCLLPFIIYFFFLKVNLSFQLDEQQRFPCGTHLDGGKHKVHGCTLPGRQTSGFFSNDVLLKRISGQRQNVNWVQQDVSLV